MIKALIFDFGDVFINLDKDATVREITKYFGPFEVTTSMDHINMAYEKGLITTKAFLNFYKDYFKTNDTSVLAYAWNAIILDFPEARLRFIETLSKETTYKLILLSNTNTLHIEKVIENMTPKRYERFKACFHKFYLSHEIHYRKPDADIYNFVLQENGLLASECFFIDDTKANTDTASRLGIHSWNINPLNEDITQLFKIYESLFT